MFLGLIRTYRTYWTYMAHPHNRSSLNAFAVIHRLFALLQRYVRLLPGRLTSFIPTSSRGFAHVVYGPHMVYFHLEDCLNGRLDLRLSSFAINSKAEQLPGVLRLFFGYQRFLGDHRRLDDVPNSFHCLARL